MSHLGWPGAAQICRIERTRDQAGAISHGVANAVTGLSPEKADPDTLLALWRDHWHIETRLHRRRDVILREDHSPVRSGTSLRAIAALRNTLLDVVRDAAEPLAEIGKIFAEHRLDAVTVAQRGIL